MPGSQKELMLDGMNDQWTYFFVAPHHTNAGSQTSTLTRFLLTYRHSIFVTVYSHLLCVFTNSPCPFLRLILLLQVLDHTSQIWWRWINISFTLVIWSVELLVSTEDDEAKEWKVD